MNISRLWLILLCGSAMGAADEFAWRSDPPAAHGVDGAALARWQTNLAARGSKALLVIRDDRLLAEWYAPGHGPRALHYTASLAKAVIGGLGVALALDEKALTLDDPVSRWIPRWRTDPRKRRITFRHLGSHTSGLDDAEAAGRPHHRLTGWKGDFWKRRPVPRDPFTLARDAAPLLFPPGTDFQYSNPGIAMLSYGTAAALAARFPDRPPAETANLRTLLRERVFRPIGIADGEWSCGYGKVFEVDGLPLVAAWGGGNFTARALARVGRLMLREGDWDGRRILSRAACRAVTRSAGLPGAVGIGWWSNADGRWPSLPRDAFAGAGAQHQILLVVPSLDLIVVRNGRALGPGETTEAFWAAAERHLFAPLMAAFFAAEPSAPAAAPLPPSPALRIRWAPASTIQRRGTGSDNWPLTAGDDGWLYTAYGDGRGFAPFVPEKLSLGFARLRGRPWALSTENLRSPTGEQRGDGPRGLKAGGLLMLDGTLYLLARNATNACLAWSTNHARAWTWADWRFTESFGCPDFLNFGPNYAGARDDRVYVFSPDTPSAYRPGDAVVLARAPRDRLREQAAWEFYAGRDAQGRPRWSATAADRAPVLRLPGRCHRLSVSYCAPWKRYLLVMTLPPGRLKHDGGAGDLRFQGGLALFDAPEPWGPWTTVHYRTHWDAAPGESARLPTAWMDPQGRDAWLLHSGRDAFSLRRLMFEPNRPAQ